MARLLSAGKWNNAPPSNTCGDNSKILKDECVRSLITAMNSCNPNSGTTNGALLQGKCIQYITLDGVSDPKPPPWTPKTTGPQPTDPQCDTHALSDVQNNFFSGLYPQFCASVNGGDKLSKDLTPQDFKAPSKRAAGKGAPPPNANAYPDYKFHFDWTGGTGDCRYDCAGAFKKIVDAPCGFGAMALKSSINFGCGTYSYEITSPPKSAPLSQDPVVHCNATNSPNYASYGSINYQDFCKNLPSLEYIDNSINPPLHTNQLQGGSSRT
ncbi:hypothetical protein B0J14DRAFT_276626 [Halenospora varia]|nr:hypothetical protein B0J14DRAFT_276626 [Halenospora varia]